MEFIAVNDKAYMYVLGLKGDKMVTKQIIEPPKNSNSSKTTDINSLVISDLIALSCGWIFNVTFDGVFNIFGPKGAPMCCGNEKEKKKEAKKISSKAL